MTSPRRTLSYANVTATLALVVALSGTSYAAVQLPKNSVGAKQIKTDAVKSAEVKNGSIKLADINKTELPKLKGAPGAPGTARAYGVFTSGGVLVAARSKNVTVTKFPATAGQYCVKPTAASGIDAAKTTIVATPDYFDGAGENHIVQIVLAAAGSLNCPGGYQLSTRNFDDDADNYVDTNLAVSFVIP
jgi:hypothetical protein